MAALNFPNSPSTNDIHTENGLTFKWNGTIWKKVGPAYTDTTNLNVTGIGTIAGNFHVGGVLTYEDVKNVDSVGIITARDDVHIADKIVHTGDTNTAIRFPAADTITAETGGSERLRIESNGKIAIGNHTGASHDIHIKHASSPGIRLEDTTNTVKLTMFAQDSNSGIANFSNHPLLFYTNSINRIQLTNDGKIQIGLPGGSNSLPSAVDSVSIRARDEGNLHIRDIGNLTSSPAGTGVGIDVLNNASNAVKDLCIRASTLIFRHASGESLRIDSSGRVLIGTTDPGSGNADELTLAGSGSSGLTIRSGTSNTGSIFFSDATSGAAQYAGAVEFNHGDNAMKFMIGNSPRLRIDQYGRVMIGTSTAGDGGADDLNIATTGQTGITIRSGTGSGGQIYFADGTSGDDRFRGIVSYQHGSNYMRFYTDASERLRIDSVGRHGINVTNTGDYYSAADDLIIREKDGGDSGITIRTGTANSGLICFADGASSTSDQYRRGQIRYHHNSDSMDFTTGGNTARLTISSGGGILIGSGNQTKTQDGVLIERNSGDGIAHITAGRSGGNYSGFNYYVAGASGVTLRHQIDYQSNFKWFAADGTTERFRITSAGKVCINNDTALSDLHVCTAGSSEQDGTLRIGGTNAELGLVLDYDQASATVSRITANPTYNNTSALLKICVDGDTNPNQLVLMGSGKIGIGIVDNTAATLQVRDGSSGSGTIRLGGSNSNGIGMDMTYSNSGATSTVFKQNYRVTNDGALMKFDSGYFAFHTGTAGTERLRIDSSGRLQLGSISGNSQWGQDIINIESGGDAGISIGRLEGGSPTNGQQLGSYSFQSAIGSQNAGSAEAKITAFAAENQSGSTAATDMSFWVKASGTGPGSAPTERMRLDSTGRLILNPANGDFTNPDIGGSTAGVTINKNTAGQIYACTDAGGSAASNDTTSTVLNLCRRNGAGDGPQLALDRGGWIKASLAGLVGSNTANGGKGMFAIYTHDYSSGANVRYERVRIDAGGVQNYTGGSADNHYANFQVRHKTPYSTDGGYPGSIQTSTNQTVFSLYNESYGGNRMAFRSGQGHQFEIETKTRDIGSGSYNDADVYFRGQYDGSLTDRYIIGTQGGHTFQNRSKVTLGVGSGGDVWFGESPYSSQWAATSAGGWYYREDQTSMIIASRAHTGYSTFYINKNTGGGGGDTRWIDFYWNSGQYGRIEYNGASGTNYNTSSDYRLKENVVSITDGIAKVKQLKPYRFNFKSDTTDKVVQGFFAHEAQEVVPYAVNGTKDEVVTQAQVDAGSQPEDKAVGDPIYQNVDYAKFTPILTAALQEAIAKIEVLEAKVAALEGS